MSTGLDRVRAFVVRLAGEPVCEDCVIEKLDLTVREHAAHKTREFAGEPGFCTKPG